MALNLIYDTPMKTIYDKEASLKLAGGNEDLAVQMFDMLRKELPELQTKMNQAFQDHNNDEFLNVVHKINGSTRYCGVPELYASIDTLELYLKGNAPQAELIARFLENANVAINELLAFNPGSST